MGAVNVASDYKLSTKVAGVRRKSLQGSYSAIQYSIPYSVHVTAVTKYS